jgi:6-phosphofructokinase 2
MLIVGGSFPPGFGVSQANHLIGASKARGIPVVVDIPGELLRKIHLDGLLLIKPNLSEFQELVGRKVKSISSIARLAQTLAKKVGLVCVSSVKGGALLASRDFVWFGVIPKIKIKNTVGAGDSMVAGMTAILWRQKITVEVCNDDLLLPELLRQGLAAAAATLATSGTELGDAKSMRKFSMKIAVKKIHI